MTFSTPGVKKSSLFEVLTEEVNYRSLIGLLTILVVMLHAMGIIWLLQPTDAVKQPKPVKIVAVTLTTTPKPKAELKPEPKPKPKIVQPTPQKKQPPKKMAGKPPVKEKAPVVTKQPVTHKRTEQPKPKPIAHKPIEPPKSPPVMHKQAELAKSPPVLTHKSTALSTPPTFYSPAKITSPTAHAPQLSGFTSKNSGKKPAEKTGGGGHDNHSVNSGVVELVQAKPNYPMRAKSRHIEGWIKIAFTVTASGSVTNAHVVGASPPGMFDSSALETIQKFKFKPKIVNGKAVNGEATKTFSFKLN